MPSRLLWWAEPLTGVDYMLLRIETLKMRDDCTALSSIRLAFDQAMDAMEQIDDQGSPRVADAEVFIRSAAAAKQ
jgi:hypothetical protein